VSRRSDKVAGDCLKNNNWNVEAALDYFYSSGLSATVTGVDTRQVDAMFNKYKGKHQWAQPRPSTSIVYACKYKDEGANGVLRETESNVVHLWQP
jgi:hypothetical protein